MGKKFGKFLLFTAAVGAAGAAAYYYMKKKDASLLGESDDDYDDFSEDAEEDSSARSYVPLNHDETAATENGADSQEAKPADDLFTPLAEQVTQAAETAKNEVEEAVEEFFDDEEPAAEE